MQIQSDFGSLRGIPGARTRLGAILAFALIAIAALAMTPTQPAHAQTTFTMTITSSTADSHPLQGYYVILYDSSGNVVDTGFTPASFSVAQGQTYSVQADSYGNCQFDAWGGADHPAYFDNPHTFTASPSLDLLAIYNCSTSSGTSQLTISTVDQNGNPISGYYTVLNQSNTVVATGFTTHSFTVNNGQTYTFQVDNYGSCTFSHWTNGATTQNQTIFINGGDLGFTAVMNCGTGGASTSTVIVNSVDQNGNPISGYYTVLYNSSGNVIATGFTTATFTTPDQAYNWVLQVDNYGSCSFANWSPANGGSTANPITFTTPLAGTSETLTAVYNCG